MKEYGWPRPSCEECGLVEMEKRGVFIINFINEYWTAIVSQSSFGNGYSINGEIVFKLAKEEVDNLKVLLKFIVSYINSYMNAARVK